MPITLKKDVWKVKDPSSGQYRGAAILSTTLPQDAAQIISESNDTIQSIKDTAIDAVDTALNDESTGLIPKAEADRDAIDDSLNNATNGIIPTAQSDRDDVDDSLNNIEDGIIPTAQANLATIAQAVQSQIGQGTDKTLSVAKGFADAKAAGMLVRVSNYQPGSQLDDPRTSQDASQNTGYPVYKDSNRVWVKETYAELEVPTMDDHNELKSALDEMNYRKVVFAHTEGTTHSSANDQIKIQVLAGETIYVRMSSDARARYYIHIYAFYSDGTASKVVAENNVNGCFLKIVATKDIDALGIHIGNSEPTGIITFELFRKSYYEDYISIARKAAIDIAVNELYGNRIETPILSNGSLQNPGNAFGVHTEAIPIHAKESVTIVINRELPEGHVYIIGTSEIRSSGANINKTLGENVFTLYETSATTIAVSFNIFELASSGGEYIVLNPCDFKLGDIAIVISPRPGSLMDQVDNFAGSIVASQELAISPTLSNGSGGNPGNANGVTARAIPFKGAYAITFINKHPLKQEGNYYKYDISAFRGTAWYTNLITGVLDNTFTFHAQDIIKDRTDVDGFGITIWEYDSNNAFVALRNIDFDPAEFIVRYTYQLEEDANNIVNRNEDMRLAVYASSNYGHNGQSIANIEKVLSMLAVADIHDYPNLLSNASKYLDAIPSLDCGIVLGDIMSANYAESDGTWYTNIINDTSKIIYTVIGNHDGGNSKTKSISGTKQEVFNKFIAPVKAKMGMANLSKTYYSVNFSTYKITMIVLDNYDAPDTISGDNFVVSRGAEALSQEQVDWLISTLNAVPSDYTVVVARHSSTGATWNVFDCAWTKVGSSMGRSEIVYDALPVNDIVHAWQTGGSLNRTYNPTDTGLPTLTVSCDFSSRGIGKFACYLFGHSHCDTVAYDEYGNLGVQFDTASSGNSQPGNSDLPRINGLKSEDCITVVSIDTYRSLLKLVRIGSNVSMNMVDRKYIALPFHKEVT